MLEVELSYIEHKAIMKINGVLDYSTTDLFHQKLTEINEIKELKIDFSNLEFIDSTGVGSILEVIYSAQEKKFKVSLIGLSKETESIFETVGVFQIIEALGLGGE